MSKFNNYHKWLFHKDYTKWTYPIINRLYKKAVFKIFEVTNVWVNVTTITGEYSRWFYSRWSQKNYCLQEVLKNVFNEKPFSYFFLYKINHISLRVELIFCGDWKFFYQFPFWQDIVRNDPQVFYRTKETLLITRINPDWRLGIKALIIVL